MPSSITHNYFMQDVYNKCDKKIKDKIIDSKVHDKIFGSDHCPVELDIQI